jgi:CDP-4-dehydro-6-deoxyglucose reductase
VGVGRTLSLARAARLAGVPRGALQRMIAAGELASFDGEVSVEELLLRFPDLAPVESGALERVEKIREQAFARRVREFVLPSQEVLSQRLFAARTEMAELRRHLQAYHEEFTALRAFAQDLAGDGARREALLARFDAALRRLMASEPGPLEEKISMLEAITALVTVRPSGLRYLVEGNDSLLQAGIKAGARLGYGCGSGNCGLCRARVVQGEVREIAHSDYRLSEAERAAGHVLLCTHTAVSDVVIETIEARGPEDLPRQEIVATVRAVRPLAADVLLLHVQTPRSHRLRFLAGQSVALGWAGAAGDRSQTLPLANCPCDERNLHFHVSRAMVANGGEIAEALFAGSLAPGQSVDIRGPVGDFVLDLEAPHAPVFVACDAGFGPIHSIIESALASDRFESIRLLWCATTTDGHYLANQCRAWAASLEGFAFELISAPDAGAAGALAATRIAALGEFARPGGVYAAGPAQFLERLVAAGGNAQVRTLAL